MANTIGVAVQVTADAGGFRKSIDLSLIHI